MGKGDKQSKEGKGKPKLTTKEKQDKKKEKREGQRRRCFYSKVVGPRPKEFTK